jgi:hypothetical protein
MTNSRCTRRISLGRMAVDWGKGCDRRTRLRRRGAEDRGTAGDDQQRRSHFPKCDRHRRHAQRSDPGAPEQHPLCMTWMFGHAGSTGSARASTNPRWLNRSGRILTLHPPEPTRLGGKFGGTNSTSPPMQTCEVSDSQSWSLHTMASGGSVKVRPADQGRGFSAVNPFPVADS